MFTYLNGIDVKCFDVQNSYLNAKPKERVWFWAGQEFDVHKVNVVVVVRELYVLKGDGSAWSLAPRKSIRYIGFNPFIADGDVRKRKSVDY